MLQLDWLIVRLRPNSVSSGSTEMQFDCTEQSPQPSQTAALIITRRDGSSIRPRLRRRRFSAAQVCTNTIAEQPGVSRSVRITWSSSSRWASLTPGAIVFGRIGVRIFRDQVDFAHAFAVQLEGDLLRREIAVHMLAAGHGDGVVVEDLVGDVGLRGDRLADREAARVEVGAVAEIGEDVLLVGERRDADPGHALAAHMGEGLGVAVHPQRHEVAADAGQRAAAFRHLGRGVVRDSPSRSKACGRRAPWPAPATPRGR